MANKNKKIVETIYRDTINNERWRFLGLGRGVFDDCWKMVRVKDGHRLYWKTNLLKEEKQ